MSNKKRSSGEEKDSSRAEKITLAISSAILLLIVALILSQGVDSGNEPVVIIAEPQFAAMRQEGSRFYLPVHVRNEGDQTASDVTVEFMHLHSDGRVENTRLTVNFLAGGAEDRGVVVFNQNPNDGQLTHTISFLQP